MKNLQVGFPIRISPDQWIFAPPRSFSQLITSFIGSQCQGIHPALLMLDLLYLRSTKLAFPLAKVREAPRTKLILRIR